MTMPVSPDGASKAGKEAEAETDRQGLVEADSPAAESSASASAPDAGAAAAAASETMAEGNTDTKTDTETDTDTKTDPNAEGVESPLPRMPEPPVPSALIEAAAAAKKANKQRRAKGSTAPSEERSLSLPPLASALTAAEARAQALSQLQKQALPSAGRTRSTAEAPLAPLSGSADENDAAFEAPPQAAPAEDDRGKTGGLPWRSLLLAPFRLAVAFGLGGWLLLGTLAWFGGVVYYFDTTIGFDEALSLPPSEIALFASGVSLPVFALWFAFAYFRQARLMTAQFKALTRSAEQAEAQSRTASLTEQHLRLNSYLALTDFYLTQMAKEAAILAGHVFRLTKPQEEQLWQRFAQGDKEVFFRLFFEKPGTNLAERISKTVVDIDNAAKSAHLFCGHYQVFLHHAESVDRGNLMLEAHKNGYLGDLSRVVNKALYGTENPFSE